MIEEDFAREAKQRQAGPPLEQWSIEELEARVERLRGEIAQCEQLIAAKRSHRSAADAVFGKPSA